MRNRPAPPPVPLGRAPFPPRSFRSPLWPGVKGWWGGCKCCGRPLLLPFPRVPWCCSWCFGSAARSVVERGEKVVKVPKRWRA